MGKLIDADAAIKAVCEEVMDRFFVPPSAGYDVAEEALKKLPSVQPETNCSEIPNNSDTISKQAAIESEAISKWKKEFREYVDSLDIARDDWKGIIEYIDELPSAEPDTTTHDSIPAETGKNDGDKTSGDCISRQQAIDALKELTANGTNKGMVFGEDAVHRIEILPSVQPERKTGHWIEIALSNHTYKCSMCGRLLANITDGKNNVAKNYPYCHCGADMRGEQDE